MRLFWQNKSSDPSEWQNALEGINQFAIDLYQKQRDAGGNLFFSPYSISAALAMTSAAARGETLEQITRVLHFIPDQAQLHPAFKSMGGFLSEIGRQAQIELTVANSLWPHEQTHLRKEFLALVRKYYGVTVNVLDFTDAERARGIINAWVEQRTGQKIKDLIGAGVLDELTRLVLVNAIYFKGDWTHPFDRSQTEPAPFIASADEQVTVQMMKCKHAFRYLQADGLQVLELPYGLEELSMLVVLPQEVDGLAGLEAKLTLQNLNDWTKGLVETEVEVSLPRFELEFPLRLDESLKSLGMTAAFSSRADFTGLDPHAHLFIGAVLHKAYVAVNEQGTEAAAATAVVVQLKAISLGTVRFRADHPFIFLIRENKTGRILFLGRLAKPAG